MLELGWIAGLIEGEGSFIDRRNNGDLAIQIGMTDRDTIDRVHRILGFGTMKTPRQLPSGKIFYGWSVTNQHQAAGLMMTLLPLMSQRRSDKIKEHLALWRLKPRERATWTHCKRGHPLYGSNMFIYLERGKYEKRKCRECNKIRTRIHQLRAEGIDL